MFNRENGGTKWATEVCVNTKSELDAITFNDGKARYGLVNSGAEWENIYVWQPKESKWNLLNNDQIPVKIKRVEILHLIANQLDFLNGKFEGARRSFTKDELNHADVILTTLESAGVISSKVSK